MRRKQLCVRILFFLVILPLATSATRALATDDVAARIQQLEEAQQKNAEELEKLKSQQIELKKDATAAAAALPIFQYRPGFLGITAADKSWQISFAQELHIHMYNHPKGEARSGLTSGDLFMRRNRPYIYYCWSDCFYEIGFGLDLDTGDQTQAQTTRFIVHFEHMNPYYPTFEIADKGLQALSYVGRSSSRSAAVELARDLLTDSDVDTLSHRGMGVGWLGVPAGPADVTLWTEYRVGSGINLNRVADTNRRQFFLKSGIEPFKKIKNKWISRLKFGGSWTTDSVDPSERAFDNNRLRIRASDRIGRLVVFDTGGNIGRGQHHNVQLGAEWGVGPYLIRNESGWAHFENGSAPSVTGYFWRVAHELFLWSPKGVLTGSATTPGSLLLGWAFARADARCPSGSDCVPGASTSAANHLTQRELDLWYFIRNGLSVGTWWNWWNTPNMPTTLQKEIGCASTPRVGKSCSWHSINLGLRVNF